MMTEERAAYFDWKKKALRFILDAMKMENKGSSMNRSYCNYIKQFFFGDSHWHDLECETWKMRKANQELPMSWAQWYIG